MKKIRKKGIKKQKRWALLVGANLYWDNAISDLRYSVNDARVFHNLLLSQPESEYSKERMQLLTSESKEHMEANRLNIFDNLEKLTRSTEQEDMLLFYFSGHGELVDGDVYLLPSDVINNHLLPDTSISLERIKEIVLRAKARTKVIILDACKDN